MAAPELLVVAGEASGDRAAAAVLARLPNVHAFGLGGPALARAGAHLTGDLRQSTALGIGEVAARALSIGSSLARVLHEAKKRRPRAALLVNYSEFNTRVAHALHGSDVRVLWYIAPQVWAWRAERTQSLRRVVDRMAVILPFEEELWRKEGIDAHYVGHPALEEPAPSRREARDALRLTPYAWTVAILPGSRPHEVRSLLGPMLAAYETVRHERASLDARVLIAPSLDAETQAWVETSAHALRVETTLVDPSRGAQALLPAFDVALCASGTATLEAALARAIPIVTYRVGKVTEVLARHFVKVPNVALPNIVLGRKAFPELLQRQVNVETLAQALADVLDARDTMLSACAELESAFGPPRQPSAEVARMLRPWLKLE